MHDDRLKPLILVADDDSLARLMAEEALREGGFAARVVENGKLAVEEFRKSSPDLVMLDVVMPEMDGFAACSEIRKSPGGENTPILLLTGMDDVESVNRAYEAGATDFQSKPLNWTILMQRIRYMLRSSSHFEAMVHGEAKNTALLAAIPDLMFILDRDGVFTDYKPSSEIATLVPPESFLNKRITEVLPPDVASKCMLYLSRVLESKESMVFEYPITDGNKTREYEARYVAKGGNQVLAIVRDITRQKQVYRALKKEKSFIATILDTTSALVIVRDPRGRIVLFNRACERVTGYRFHEVQNKLVWDFMLKPEDIVPEKMAVQELLRGKSTNEFRASLITKSGDRRLVAWSYSVLLNRDKKVEYIISTGIDITERQQAEDKVQFLAYYDGLTNLPNRLLFKEHLNQALAYSQRHERLMALLFIDIDRFKQINDTFGHSLGDLLLKGIAARLKICLRSGDYIARREMETMEASVSRFGGDEFTVLIPDVPNTRAVAKVVRRIQNTIAERFELDNKDVFVTSSVGISVYPHDGTDAETLLKYADMAMYMAKEEGRGGYHFYDASMNQKIFDKLTMENDLRKAIASERFMIYYQPKLDVKTRKLVGAEALLRWKHPTKGLISPVEFIPLAEETGLIKTIGLWGLHEVCKQSVEWQKSGLPPTQIAVNVSSIQFQQKDLTETILRVLSDTGLDPQLIEVEVTESAIMQNEEEAGRILMRLKDAGISISIDDFGTGYSSLYYLKRFTLDCLKIDRSFIKDLNTDPDDRAITNAIINMAHNLELKVIAEGVETTEQLAFLRDQGCDYAQGYLFSRPLPSDKFAEYLAEHHDREACCQSV